MKQNEKKRKYPKLAGEIVSHGETYEDLTKVTGLSKQAISRRMTGVVPWQIGEIKALIKHYEVDFKELFKESL